MIFLSTKQSLRSRIKKRALNRIYSPLVSVRKVKSGGVKGGGEKERKTLDDDYMNGKCNRA